MVNADGYNFKVSILKSQQLFSDKFWFNFWRFFLGLKYKPVKTAFLVGCKHANR